MPEGDDLPTDMMLSNWAHSKTAKGQFDITSEEPYSRHRKCNNSPLKPLVGKLARKLEDNIRKIFHDSDFCTLAFLMTHCEIKTSHLMANTTLRMPLVPRHFIVMIQQKLHALMDRVRHTRAASSAMSVRSQHRICNTKQRMCNDD